MPLMKSASPAAFKQNIKTEVAAGRPIKQAVAIAYATKRQAQRSVNRGSHAAERAAVIRKHHRDHGY